MLRKIPRLALAALTASVLSFGLSVDVAEAGVHINIHDYGRHDYSNRPGSGYVEGAEDVKNAEPDIPDITIQFDQYGNRIGDPEQFANAEAELTDPASGIGLGIRKLAPTWTIAISDNASIRVQEGESALHQPGACDACDTLREKSASGEVQALYSVAPEPADAVATITNVIRDENGINRSPITDIYYTVNIPVPKSADKESIQVFVCEGEQPILQEMRIQNNTIQFNNDALSPFGIAYRSVAVPDEPAQSNNGTLAPYRTIVTPDIPDDDDVIQFNASDLIICVLIALVSFLVSAPFLLWAHRKEIL